MTRLQEVEKLLIENIALVTEYSKRAAELWGEYQSPRKRTCKPDEEKSRH